MESGNGGSFNGDWNRWRGGVDQRLDGLHEDVLVFRDWKQTHEKDCDVKRAAIHERINSGEKDLSAVSMRVARIETRVAIYGGIGAGIGGAIIAFIQWLLK